MLYKIETYILKDAMLDADSESWLLNQLYESVPATDDLCDMHI